MEGLAAETVARVRDFLVDHPLVLPLVVVALVVAVVACGPLARRVGCGRAAAALLVLACTLPLALTLPPTTDPAAPVEAGCALALKSLPEWGQGGEELANLAMLAPAGALLAALLRRRAAVVALLVGAASPVVVEAVQLLLPVLRRSCESTDVVLNVAGLAVGALVGLALRRVLVVRPALAVAARGGPPT